MTATRLAAARVLAEGTAVLAAGVALWIYLTWPLPREFGDHIWGIGGDSTGGMAYLRLWADELGYSVTGVTQVSAFGAPFGFEVGNGVNLQSAFAFLPAYLVSELANEIVAYNVVVLTGLVLSGAAMYWLVRWLGCARLTAAWAGLVYVVFPWHLEKAQGHPSLAHLEGFPLLLLAMLAWYRRPDLRHAAWIAAALTVLWTTSGYYGFMALAVVPTILALAVVSYSRTVGLGGALRRAIGPGVASLAVPVVIYAVASTSTTPEGLSTPRAIEELHTYGARPWEYLLPSYRNPQFGDDVGQWLAAHLHGSNFSETSLYVGWLTILLAAGWLGWAAVRRSRLQGELPFATVALAATVVVGLVFSLPNPLPRTDISTPVRLIWEAAPQFRVPARFIAAVMAGLIPLAALGLESLRRLVAARTPPGLPATAAGAAICVAAGVLSFYELSISPPATVTDLGTAPPEYSAVRLAPPGLLAEYPLAPANQAITSDYLFWQRAHGRRLVNGAPAGTFSDAVRETIVDPAAPGTAEALAGLGVSVIIVRPGTYAFTGGPPEAPARLGPGYRLLRKTAAGATVWQVTAKPARVVTAFTTNFYGAETPSNRPTMRWMSNPGRVTLYSKGPGRQKATFTVASYGRPRRLRIQGRLGYRVVLVGSNARRVSLPVSTPRGRSTLVITALPGPQALPDGRQATVYMSNWRLEPLESRSRQTVAAEPLRTTSPG